MSFIKKNIEEIAEELREGKAFLCYVAGGYCFAWAIVSQSPKLEPFFIALFWVGLACLSVAGLWIKDIWRRTDDVLPWLFLSAGVTMAVIGIYLGLGLLISHEGSTRRMMSGNNLKMLGMALWDYEKQNGTLPPAAAYDKTGRRLLSWRVLILPSLEKEGSAERRLFQQFNLDEPWDSPHNIRLLEKMPKVYAPPEGIPNGEPYTTFYQVFVGKGTAFEGKEGIPLADFPDGLSETILVVEAGKAVPWTRPEDLPYAADQTLHELGSLFPHGFHACFGDGVVHFLARAVKEATIRAFITRNAGDKPGNDW